jgi:hypothetical protein
VDYRRANAPFGWIRYGIYDHDKAALSKFSLPLQDRATQRVLDVPGFEPVSIMKDETIGRLPSDEPDNEKCVDVKDIKGFFGAIGMTRHVGIITLTMLNGPRAD